MFGIIFCGVGIAVYLFAKANYSYQKSKHDKNTKVDKKTLTWIDYDGKVRDAKTGDAVYFKRNIDGDKVLVKMNGNIVRNISQNNRIIAFNKSKQTSYINKNITTAPFENYATHYNVSAKEVLNGNASFLSLITGPLYIDLSANINDNKDCTNHLYMVYMHYFPNKKYPCYIYMNLYGLLVRKTDGQLNFESKHANEADSFVSDLELQQYIREFNKKQINAWKTNTSDPFFFTNLYKNSQLVDLKRADEVNYLY